MGTSLSTFTHNTTITRPTGSPPAISLLDFDPRAQIPPWVPTPDPHARFLASGVKSASGVSPGAVGVGGNMDQKKQRPSKSNQSQTKNHATSSNTSTNRRQEYAQNKGKTKETRSRLNSNNEDDNSNRKKETTNNKQEEMTTTENNVQPQRNTGNSTQSKHETQDMYFRERYFERRRWMEENGLPYSWMWGGYCIGYGGCGGVGGSLGHASAGNGRGRGGGGGGGGMYYDVMCEAQGIR